MSAHPPPPRAPKPFALPRTAHHHGRPPSAGQSVYLARLKDMAPKRGGGGAANGGGVSLQVRAPSPAAQQPSTQWASERQSALRLSLRNPTQALGPQPALASTRRPSKPAASCLERRNPQPLEFLLYSSEGFPMDGCPCMEKPSNVEGAYKLMLVSSQSGPVRS